MDSHSVTHICPLHAARRSGWEGNSPAALARRMTLPPSRIGSTWYVPFIGRECMQAQVRKSATACQRGSTVFQTRLGRFEGA